MSSVQIMSWSGRPKRYASYPALKADAAERREGLRQLLRKSLESESESALDALVDDVLGGRLKTLRTPDTDAAEELGRGLKSLGAEVRIREMDDAAYCDRCGSFTVLLLEEAPGGFGVFCCARCSELKRSCPDCGHQGWLLHHRASDGETEWYQCDECYSTYDSTWAQVDGDMLLRTKSERVVDYL